MIAFLYGYKKISWIDSESWYGKAKTLAIVGLAKNVSPDLLSEEEIIDGEKISTFLSDDKNLSSEHIISFLSNIQKQLYLLTNQMPHFFTKEKGVWVPTKLYISSDGVPMNDISLGMLEAEMPIVEKV